MFKTVVVALALGVASGFAPQTPARVSTVAQGAKDDLIDLAESNTDALSPGNAPLRPSNCSPRSASDRERKPSPGFWDPLGASDLNFWGLGNEGTIGYLRHAEIKHGRVAMAGFLGFCAGCTDIVKGPHSILPYRGYVENVSPQEQWDNIPLNGKLQILVLVGMLESYGEGAGCDPSEYTHYTQGGLPGFYPSIKGKGLGQISLDGRVEAREAALGVVHVLGLVHASALAVGLEHANEDKDLELAIKRDVVPLLLRGHVLDVAAVREHGVRALHDVGAASAEAEETSHGDAACAEGETSRSTVSPEVHVAFNPHQRKKGYAESQTGKDAGEESSGEWTTHHA